MPKQKTGGQLIRLANIALDGALVAFNTGEHRRAAALVANSQQLVNIDEVLRDRAKFGNARAFISRLNKACCVVASGRDFPTARRVEAIDTLARTWLGGVCRTLLRLAEDAYAPAEVRQRAGAVVILQAEPVEGALTAADIRALN